MLTPSGEVAQDLKLRTDPEHELLTRFLLPMPRPGH